MLSNLSVLSNESLISRIGPELQKWGSLSLSPSFSLSLWNFTHATLNMDLSSLAKRSFPEHELVSRLLFSSEYTHCFGLLGFPRPWLPNLAVIGTPIHQSMKYCKAECFPKLIHGDAITENMEEEGMS